MNEILSSYLNLPRFIGLAIGPHYQVVIYDTSEVIAKVVSVENGIVLPIELGDKAHIKVQEVIDAEKSSNEIQRTNFDIVDLDGKNLRASLYFIRDNQSKLVGVIGIFFDDSKFIDLAKDLLKLVHPDEKVAYTTNKKEEDSTSSKIYQTIEEYLSNNNMITSHYSKYEFDNTIAYLSQDARVDIVAKLEKKGIFKIKGSVVEVADILQISEPSIYRYLNKLKKGEK